MLRALEDRRITKTRNQSFVFMRILTMSPRWNSFELMLNVLYFSILLLLTKAIEGIFLEADSESKTLNNCYGHYKMDEFQKRELQAIFLRESTDHVSKMDQF